MRVADIRTLYDYYLANTRILDAAARLGDERFVAPPVAGDRSLHSILVHTLSAERGWRLGWQGQGRVPGLRDEDFPSVAALAEHWREEERDMRAYLATLCDDDLEGHFYTFTLWHVLAHVANHGTQHRSEAAMLLTHWGCSPGDLDFVFFLEERQEAPAS